MAKEEQGLREPRYQVIPRTLIFLRRGDEYLLLKGAPNKKRFAGLYNGLGGHVERGESVRAAARRELEEETGLQADLELVGTVLVDVEPQLGVLLFVFSGAPTGGSLRPSAEGRAEWISYARVDELPAVPDLRPLLARVHARQPGEPPFSARSFYDPSGRLQLRFE